jgi:predicted kinase
MINIHDIFFINKTNLSAKDLANKLSGYGAEFVRKLISLASADNKGRICKNRVDEIDFVEYADEVLERVLMLNLAKKYDESNYKNFKDNVAIVMVGLPYSGKSTHIQNMSNSGDYVVISRDNIIMSLANGESYNKAWNKVDQQKVNRLLDVNLRSAVNYNKNLIVDMTNLSAKSRRGKINMLSSDYSKNAWVFYVGMNELKRRMDIRKDKVISEEVIFGMMKQYTIPMFDEFDSISFLYGDGSFQMVNNF